MQYSIFDQPLLRLMEEMGNLLVFMHLGLTQGFRHTRMAI